MTPIHVAAYKKNVALCRFLLSCGADPKIPNDQGHTPYDLACEAVLQVLKEDMMVESSPSVEMQLLEASKDGDLATVKVKRHANIS